MDKKVAKKMGVCDDLISRQAAIDALDSINCYGWVDDTWETVCDIIKHIPPANSKHRWIPVTEHKPQRYSHVWVTDFGETEIGYYSSDGRWFDTMGNKLKDVTAWMPPPEPYREETEDANNGQI